MNGTHPFVESTTGRARTPALDVSAVISSAGQSRDDYFKRILRRTRYSEQAMREATSTRQIEHRAANDGGAAFIFYLLTTGFVALLALILWYFPAHV